MKQKSNQERQTGRKIETERQRNRERVQNGMKTESKAFIGEQVKRERKNYRSKWNRIEIDTDGGGGLIWPEFLIDSSRKMEGKGSLLYIWKQEQQGTTAAWLQSQR